MLEKMIRRYHGKSKLVEGEIQQVGSGCYREGKQPASTAKVMAAAASRSRHPDSSKAVELGDSETQIFSVWACGMP